MIMELIQKRMDKKQIEKFLRTIGGKETSRVSFSSYVDVEKIDDLVVLKLSSKSLIDNMQSDASAFESWALIIRAAFESVGIFVRIRIDGEKLDELPNRDKNHYNRFLYRIGKFVDIFEWAYTDDFSEEIAIFNNAHTNMVLNVPTQEAKKEAEKGEATMEREFCIDNKSLFDCLDHQLPVRLFDDGIGETAAVTAGGFVDAWAIIGNTVYIFELKLGDNRKVGAIAELMFYVNVISDVMTQKIQILSNSQYRSFDKLKELYDSRGCQNVVGRIIAKKSHPLVAITNKTIADAFSKHHSSICIKIETDVNRYINNYKLR